MNFIQQAYKGKNDWFYYLGVLFLVLICWQFLGVIPLAITAVLHAGNMDEFLMAANDNFMTLGINKSLFLFMMILMFAIGLAALLFSIKYIHKRAIKTLVTSREKIDWKRFWFGFFTWGIVAIVVIGAGIVLEPDNYTWNFKPIPFFTLVLVSFLFLPLQTSFEELLFRGYFMQGLGLASLSKKFPLIFLYFIFSIILFICINNVYVVDLIINLIVFMILTLTLTLILSHKKINNFYNSKLNQSLCRLFGRYSIPLIITSVAFGLLHGANPEVEKLGYISMVFYIGTGFFFGITTLMDEGTELALGLHAINNIVAAFLVTTDWTVFQTDALFIDTSEPSVGIEMFLPVFVLYPLMLLLFSKKYGWKNWKEKLFGTIEKPLTIEEY
ncbi:CPBP family glutamic-type intramembrane protease [Tenacibaculum aiptasiae]|uniref:CPBP family glutamic-type intramembrane protease n=1 Tax=Tenacibaculum aiptasiae TaxID=426481 RepID=UPI001FE46810|nr:CPBP family glutamic-type intramembrane protease [Tenacibaculum aiptasiae]